MKTVTLDEFLAQYDKITREYKDKDWERVLYHLLEANKEYIKETFENDFEYFHKSFRQWDVIPGKGDMDMAIWICLDKTFLFWELREILRKGVTDPKEVSELILKSLEKKSFGDI